MPKSEEDLARRLGEVIRDRRERAEMTQAELASLSRLNRNYIGMVERAERNPTVLALVAMASALGTQGHVLLREAERR